MQITGVYQGNLNNSGRNISVAADSNANAGSAGRTASFSNVLVNELPNNLSNNLPAHTDPGMLIRNEINILLQQFSEWIRVATESKRMEFLYSILLRENHETSDLFGKIMDIARRIMNGDTVTLEEMQFLSEQNPQLLYVVIMLKEESANVEDKERRREKERRRKDRRSGARRRENLRSNYLNGSNGIENMNYFIPRSSDTRINSFLAQKSIEKSYNIKGTGRNSAISVNTVITNPLDASE